MPRHSPTEKAAAELRRAALALWAQADALEAEARSAAGGAAATIPPAALDRTDGLILLAMQEAGRYLDTAELSAWSDCGLRTVRRRLPPLIRAKLAARTAGKIGVTITAAGTAALAGIRHGLAAPR